MASSGFNPDSLVAEASFWSMAGDSRLLEALQQLSSQLSQQTKQVQAQLDQLAVTTSRTATRLANTTNNFMLLSNTQFIEARVYEDAEVEAGVEEDKQEVVKSNEELLEQSNQLICGALKLGINVIETAFEKVEIDDSDSDDDEAHPNEVVLQPKNPYHVRPLPCVIGTQAFHDDDHVGLIDEDELSPASDDDDESEESDSESEHPEEDDKMSEYSVSDDEVDTQPPVQEKKPNVDHFFGEDSESEFSDDDLFGASKVKKELVGEKVPSIDSKDEDLLSDDENTEEEPVTKKQAGPMSFTSELSAKLGLGPAVPSKSSTKAKDAPDSSQADDGKSINSSVTSDRVGKSKKSVMFDSSSDSEDDIFKPSKPPTKKSTVPAKEDDSTNEAKAKEKIPAGGVSILGAVKPSSKVEVNEEVKPVKADAEKPKISLSQKPKLDSLFDDLSDDDDLFADIKVVTASAKTKKATAPQKSENNQKNIFDDDDIFSDSKTANKDSNNEKEEDRFDDLFSEKKPASADKKGVSIFEDIDDDDDDLFSDLVIKKKPSPSTKAPKPKESIQEEETKTSAQNNDTVEDADSVDKVESKDKDSDEAPKIRKPIGGVSMFGGLNPKSLLKTSPSKETKQEIVKIDDPQADPERESNEVKPEDRSITNTDHDSLDKNEDPIRASTPAVLVSDKKDPGPGISKATDLINDKAPEPAKSNDSPPPTKSNYSPNGTVKDVVDKGAIDRSPDPPALLVSVAKSRPKVKSNRRPPSRGARHAAVKAAEEEAATNDIVEDADDDITENIPVVQKEISPKRQSPFGGVNLFGGVSPTDVLKKRSPTPSNKTEDQIDSNENETNESKEDSKSPQALTSDSPSSSFTPPPMSSFSPPPMTTTPPLSSFSPPPMTTPPPLSSFSPPPMRDEETRSPDSLFGSSFEDKHGLFPPSSSKIGTSAADNLFGESDDDDDMFAVTVPTPKTVKKEVKSKSSNPFAEDKGRKAAPSLFDDDSEDDDLFASLVTAKKK